MAHAFVKHLHLIRHAKSSWDQTFLSDHDRPLNDRGRNAAPLMGRAMRREINSLGAEMPQFFVSTALRARETFDGLRAGWASLGQKRPIYEGALYTFDASDLADWLSGLDADLDSVAIIGHNPAMTDLANFLYPTLSLANLPTAGWLWFSFDDVCWGEAVGFPGNARCRALYTPKAGKMC